MAFYLSDLNAVAQNVSNLIANTDNAVGQMKVYSKQINEMLVSVNSTMSGTTQREYQDLINQLVVSKKKLEFAAESLIKVSQSGNNWLREHITSSGAGGVSSNNQFDLFSSGESQTNDGECDTSENASLTDEASDVKTKKITKEEADERYKNGLGYIEERLNNHKEALIARGVQDGEWLRKTLAVEKALMIKQLANEIEVARGQAEPQNIYNILESGEDESCGFYDKMANSYFSEKQAVGPCLDWKTQPECNRTNITLNLNKTNPNYSPNTEWSVNCQRCVPTYEMRRRGYDVTAYPKSDPNDYLCRHPFEVWEAPDVVHTSGTGQQTIVDKMTEWGDGSRAQVVVVWRGVPSGHTFIAENDHGVVRFIDPQTGDEDVSRYFNRVENNHTMFCRIDDLVPSDLILECSREV